MTRDMWKPSRGWKHYALWLEGEHEEMTRRWLLAHECVRKIEEEMANEDEGKAE